MKSILNTKSIASNRNTDNLHPEGIMETLFSFRDRAHKFHLNCFINGIGSHAEHIALDGLYKGIQDKQDSILEQMMGYLMKPINAPSTTTSSPTYRNTQDSITLCTEIMEFARRLQMYANEQRMSNIENIAQELSGLAAETRYFLMFK